MGVRWQLAALIASIATTSLLGGCVVVTSGTANAYESCNSGEACTGGTACQSANRVCATCFNGLFCTASCNINSPACPADPLGGALVCVPDADGSSVGQCYLACASNGDCNPGSTCSEDDPLSPSYCVP